MAFKHDNDHRHAARAATLILGLLIGFVLGFVVLLANLPVDHAVRDLRTSNIETPPGTSRYDFYRLLASRVDPVDRIDAPPQTVLAGADGRLRAGPEDIYRAEMHATPDPAAHAGPDAGDDAGRREPVPTYPAPVTRPVPGNLQAMAPSRSGTYTEIPASAHNGERWFLQAGSFSDAANAERRRAQLLLLGLQAIVITRQNANGTAGHRVRVGPFIDQTRMDEARRRLGQARLAYEIIRVSG